MSDPFAFDPALVSKKTDYDGGLRWHTYTCATPLFSVSASGEYSADVLESLRAKYENAVRALTAHERLAWLAAQREGGV